MSSSLAGRAISPDHLPPDLAARLDDSVPTWRRQVAAIGAVELVPAWATVELDRAERELAAAVMAARQGTAAALVEDAAPDSLLGARSRRVAWSSGARLVILEPTTEGRLAGALARHGEGWVAVYAIGEAGGIGEAASHALVGDPANALGGDPAGDLVDELSRVGVAAGPVGDGPFGPERLLLAGHPDGPYVVVVSPDGPSGVSAGDSAASAGPRRAR